MSIRIQISEELCTLCGRCVKVCPSCVFERDGEGKTLVTRPDTCIKCGHCMDVCCGEAIIHEAFSPEKVHNIERDKYPSPESLMALIRGRRSNRTFTSKQIPNDVIADVIEAAYYAPTAENSRKVVVTAITSPEQLQQIEDTTMRFFLRLANVLMFPLVRPFTRIFLPDLYKEAPELARFKKRWEAGERPCSCNGTVILVFSAPKGYDFALEDCNLAYENASLMAEAHGISQVYMGLIKMAFKFMPSRKAANVFSLPKGHQVCALMSLGIPAFLYPRYTER